MFSNPLDKSCIGPDCSPGRNNASNRFPVGFSSLGDENQQIRIQLAVHKYNSSANNSLNNRCPVISPFRHSFLSNSVKAKNYEGDTEGKSKSEKRNGHQYEGVGAFPTIHLKKRGVRYRPIRRINDVKISHPELPINRFLSNLPEVCPDVKSSTRSVLDVLEDLSGKKIHLKEDSGSCKPKSKGLGGDCVLNPSALYKPLFVQKQKVHTVSTRDNTTQTLSAFGSETPSPQSSNSLIRNDASDPKAELRRKLAKQNNEIFASLSSSISSSFTLKRKIDKVLQTPEENSAEGKAIKNPKLDEPNNYNGNSLSKSIGKSKTSVDSLKPSRKSKLIETSSPTSPNKDRLTTIFLDMQNTSPKAQIFQINPRLPETKSTEESLQVPTNVSNGITGKNRTSFNGFSESNSSVSENNGGEPKDSQSINFSHKADSAEEKKPETDQPNKSEFSFPENQSTTTPNDVTKSALVTFQFGTSKSTSDFSFPKTTVESASNQTDTLKSEGDESGEEKKNTNQVSGKPFTFGSSKDKPSFSSFKFGTDGNTSSVLNSPPKDPKTSSTDVVTSSAPAIPVTASQFCFGTTTNVTTSTNQSSTLGFGVSSTQSTTLTNTTKPVFTFGQNPLIQSSTGIAKLSDKVVMANGLSTLLGTTNPGIQSNLFNFGQKPDVMDPSAKASVATVEASPQSSQSSTVTFSQSDSKLSTSSATALTPSKGLFTFGQKSETPGTTPGSAAITQDPKFCFSFGQKSGAEEKKAQGESTGKSSNLFSFGQKSGNSEETPTTTESANITPSRQVPTTQAPAGFGQIISVPITAPQIKYGQVPAPQVSSSFGTKPEAVPVTGTSTSAFSQGESAFPMKTSLFSPSANGFGGQTTQSSTGFRSSTSNTAGFGFGSSTTAQPAPTFGVTSASQTAPSFGAPSATSQSVSGFGVSSTTQSTPAFGSSPAPAFGVSRAPQPTSTFPISSTTQAESSFGATSTTQSVPTFGTAPASQATPSFGISSTTQSTTAFGTSPAQPTSAFGTSSTTQSTPSFGAPAAPFGVPTSSQPNTVFGAPAPTAASQNNATFGAPAPAPAPSPTPTPTSNPTSGFGVSQSSFTQPFDNKPTTSLGHASGIFGQNPSPSFSCNTAFSSNQNNIFEPKATTERGIFDQNKIQAPGFGTTSQTFSSPNKFSFGMSTSNATGFTTSPPNTTSAPVFSFGGSTTANTFTFGSGSSVSGNTQTPIAFKNPANEPFKFGATPAKEGSGFGESSASFSFGGQMNSNALTEQKPSFSYGTSQVSSSGPFAYGTTPSPSVFSFGSSSASSSSSFNFGTPTPGGPFGQSGSASSGAPFAVPGTFSIGSGSSQSRPRATSRPRRRP